MATGGSSEPLVVVGVDGSAESVNALKWAAGYAAATRARISAVLCWNYPAPARLAPIGKAPQAITDAVRVNMQAALDKASADVFGNSTPDKVTTKIEYGHPAMVLVNESSDADLLVVGSRGHGAFTGMLVGSVSIHCVSNAACPVVVIRGTKPNCEPKGMR